MLTVRRLDPLSVAELLPEWRSLHAAVGSWSPFDDPDLLLAWATTFCRPAQVVVLAARDDAGRLVGVAPLYRRVLGHGLLRSLQVLGSGAEPFLYESTRLLCEPAQRRRFYAAVVAWLATDDGWDTVALPFTSEQGWWEPRWAVDAPLVLSAVVPGETVPHVVVALDAGTVGSRNLRESVRRSRKRLDDSGQRWHVETARPRDRGWLAAVADLRRLHAARAALSGTVRHPDVFAGTRQQDLLAATAREARGSVPVVDRLVVGGVTVAALLSFEHGDRAWVSISGLAPDWWSASPVTQLQHGIVLRARDAGRREVVFASGVDASKLRWSESIRTVTDFVLVHARRRSDLMHSALAPVQAWRTLQRRRRDASTLRDHRSGLSSGA